jgi:hypothetical protein
MSRFIEGADRQQVTLLPECLDDFIAEDNTVRIVDAFIGELDLAALGFDGLPGRNRPTLVSPIGAAEALPVWLPEPHSIQSPVGARVSSAMWN